MGAGGVRKFFRRRTIGPGPAPQGRTKLLKSAISEDGFSSSAAKSHQTLKKCRCMVPQKRRKSIILGMNGVAVARHGPILKDNEAMGARKVFKYLTGLRDTIKKSKTAAEDQQSKNDVFYHIPIMLNRGSAQPYPPHLSKRGYSGLLDGTGMDP